MAIITCKAFGEMSLAELRAEHAEFSALLARTTIQSAYRRVREVRDVLSAAIAKAESR